MWYPELPIQHLLHKAVYIRVQVTFDPQGTQQPQDGSEYHFHLVRKSAAEWENVYR